MWNKISAESARQTSKRTHTQPTFVSTRSHYYSSLCYRAASLIHCVLPSLSRTVLPSSRFFFFFFLYNSRWNKTDRHPLPAALGHNILFLRLRRDGDEPARRAVTQQPAFASRALLGDEKKPLNSCVRAEAAFWVSKDAPL